jgi:hypothetical protein
LYDKHTPTPRLGNEPPNRKTCGRLPKLVPLF